MVKRIRKQSVFTLSDEAKETLRKLAVIRGQDMSVAVERAIFKEAIEEGIKVPEMAWMR